ncbi:MAG: CHAT domain-containing protein, partial [Pirellulales bacterium]
MTIKIIVPGTRLTHSPTRTGALRTRDAVGAPAEAESPILSCVETLATYQVSPTARAAGARQPEVFEAQEDDVIEVEFENGFTLYTSAAKYEEDLRRYAPQSATRDGLQWQAVARASRAERGLMDWGERVLRFLRVKPDTLWEIASNPDKWPEELRSKLLGGVEKKAVQLGAWVTIRALAWLLERQLKPAPGLYYWPTSNGRPTLDFASARPFAKNSPPADPQKPLLICIHGTASSTEGSFGALFVRAEKGNRLPEARPDWHRIREVFGENVLFFEHRTLSESPIENALQLVEWLPQQSQVCLLSHSRGGLVGDLVCLSNIPKDQIKEFKRGGADDAQDERDRNQLKILDEAVKDKKLQVRNFARVACPARGTLLASENIESFLSRLTSLIGLIPGVGTSMIYQVIKRVTVEVAKNRTNARWIPGIEAMVPDSPLIHLLNTNVEPSQAGTESVTARGRLGVIAGDSECGGIMQSIKTKIADWFIHSQHDNDWVVNTESMFQGAAREKEPPHYVFDQGGDVSHFNYFRNDRTRQAVVDWLTLAENAQPPAPFAAVQVEKPRSPMPRSLRALPAGAQKPLVFVLPGVMGSNLNAGKNKIWIHYGQLALGGLAKLKIDKDKDKDPVTATGLVDDYYDDLCAFLEQSHEVVRFPYDWRQSLKEAADQLAAAVRGKMEGARPIRFVAHSMGGLVVRALQAHEPKLWDEIRSRPGARVLQLGTPNQGSFAMVEALVGFDKLIRRLALLDVPQNLAKILNIVAGFPGILELLPQQERWFTGATWQELRQGNGGTGAVPDPRDLQAAQEMLVQLQPAVPAEVQGVDKRQKFLDDYYQTYVYVAGTAPRTVRDVRVVNGRLQLEVTDQGDGRVTYEAGRLPRVPTWYAAAQHGDLPSHQASFEAYEELLITGETSRLATSPIKQRDLVEATPITEPPLVLFPDADDLTDGIFGRKRARRRRASTRSIQVEIRQQDVRFAQHPVMVGHFAGDSITGPEEVINQRLRGALSRRHALGIYPGTLGSSYTVLLPNQKLSANTAPSYRGAVVIGLGNLSELSVSNLTASVRTGVLDYVLEVQSAQSQNQAAPEGLTRVGLSVLLIGSASASLLSVEESLSAILRGVGMACRDIERTQGRIVVDRLEINEMFGDSVIEAARAIPRLAEVIGQELEVHFEVATTVVQGKGRRNRLWARSDRHAWRRWEVTLETPSNPAQTLALLPEALRQRLRKCLGDLEKLDPESFAAILDMAFPSRQATERGTSLKFVVTSDRAISPKTKQDFQPEVLDLLVREAIQDSSYRPELALTLGTLLVPNDLKDSLANHSRLVLAVDAQTANYPWEMMIIHERPLALQLALIRQLQSSQFQQRIRQAVGHDAYVVGEPKTMPGIPPLPGAREEAELVTRLLQQAGYRVDARMDSPTASQVLQGLFACPYRIVHLAGHGYFEAAATTDQRARAGMLLDNGIFLTAVEVANMTQVPHLVFLNCCHLGRTESEAPRPYFPYNRLAASISQELIQLGVSAVVAAGWAVRDDAAAKFAEVFYARMLEGSTFSEALVDARRQTSSHFPDCNTWAAYQAYG